MGLPVVEVPEAVVIRCAVVVSAAVGRTTVVREAVAVPGQVSD